MTRRARRGAAGEWTQVEADTLVRAARMVPPVGGESEPWVLELHGRTAVLYELPDHARDDPGGRDRLLCCGAVLTNLWLAVRAVGRAPVLELAGRPDRPDHVFTVRGEVGEPPGVDDLADHGAIETVSWLGEHVEPEPVEPATLARIGAASRWPGTSLRPLAGPEEAAALAELALHAYRRLDGDHRLSRELAPWTEPHGRPAGSAVPSGSAAPTTVAEPRSVLCRAMAQRIAEEPVLFALAADDGRHDQLFAGAAVQSARIAAARVGLGLAAMTRLLHLPEVRAELIDRLALPGFPQALLRVGQPPARQHRWDRR